MSEIMRPISFDKIIPWMLKEYQSHGKIFGVHKDNFYKNSSGTSIELFDEQMSSAIGPAAGPNSQLAQNIVACYLAGARVMELKTVQIIDGQKLRECVPRPCINAEDEGYNVEWSTELTVQEAFNEYTKAHFAIMVAAKEFDLAAYKDFSFNMSVGYDLEGIQSEKIDNFIEGLKDASNTDIFKECKNYLLENSSQFKNIDKSYIESIPQNICSSITLSTLHGCPPDEINRIAKYLLEEKKVHTYIKCNPTLLGYEFTRKILDEMGYDYLVFNEHHFNNDLQYEDAIGMFKNLMALAKDLNLQFGVKLTNTFPVKIDNNELPGEEMYMSGRSLYPLSISLANKLSKAFNGTLPISYSGGADFFNIGAILETGIKPVTMATTILKPGGVERFKQMAVLTEPFLDGRGTKIDVEKLDQLATQVTANFKHLKKLRPTGSRKTDSNLPLYECFKAPCKDGGCPIEQQIPEYLKLVAEEKYDEAFRVIAIDNATPAITGAICDHACQTKCTRLDYDSSLNIRNSKKIAVLNAQDRFIENLKAPEIKTDKKAVVIGAGPGGVAAALFLRRNGMEVTVLEKRARPFGIVEYVIPEFRISPDMIAKDYQMALKMGVHFKFKVNPDFRVDALRNEYDFIIIATGAWKKGYVPVKAGGEKLLDALDFLLESKEKALNIDLGKRVAILGAGDVAMDCARAARRAPGVESSTIVYRRTRAFMPAEFEEIELTLNDDVKLLELLSPLSYDGNMLECEVMALGERDASNRRGVVPTGKTEKLQFDTVIAAVGARVDTALFEKNGIELNADGAIAVNTANETSIANVYVAGDSKAGAATVVSAVGDAKKIAIDILSKCELEHDFIKVEYPLDKNELAGKKGKLIDPGYDPQDGLRCLACDQICEICVDVCPNRANVVIGQNKIVHIDVMCNECGNCGVFCPHTGNPYRDKITVFWTAEDFFDSENRGFFPMGDNRFKIRDEKGKVFDATLEEGKISKQMKAYMDIIIKDFPFYLHQA
ncbi:MAG: putative selenate reductase subunit YgfK [SAR324 cluster bacterium]|nr:putative selenate reductase subunit YgfK [SAR324 cluster bacterium]